MLYAYAWCTVENQGDDEGDATNNDQGSGEEEKESSQEQ
jgi:hypothetical protein